MHTTLYFDHYSVFILTVLAVLSDVVETTVTVVVCGINVYARAIIEAWVAVTWFS